MCGITGFIGKSKANPDLLKILMLYNQERGEDSAGMFQNELLSRMMGKASDNLLLQYNVEPSEYFIGHTRKASFGSSKNIDNAHPFQFGRIVGAHNGTLTNTYALEKKYDINEDIDSKVIFKRLSTGNLDVLSDFNGAAAIIYYNIDEKCMYVFRNSERPLFRGKRDEGMYISSIESSLKCIGCTNIKEFQEDYLYKIEKGEIKETKKIKRNPIVYASSQTSMFEHNKSSHYANTTSTDRYVEMANKQTPILEFGYFWYRSAADIPFRIVHERGIKSIYFDYEAIKNKYKSLSAAAQISNNKPLTGIDAKIKANSIEDLLVFHTGLSVVGSYEQLNKELKDKYNIPTTKDLLDNPSLAKKKSVFFCKKFEAVLFYNDEIPKSEEELVQFINNSKAYGYWDIQTQKGYVVFGCNNISDSYSDNAIIYNESILSVDEVSKQIDSDILKLKSLSNNLLDDFYANGYDFVNLGINERASELESDILELSNSITMVIAQIEDLNGGIISDEDEKQKFIDSLKIKNIEVEEIFNNIQSII